MSSPEEALPEQTRPGRALPGAERRRLGLSLLATEITVLFRRKRTWAMLIALAAVPILIAVAVRLNESSTASGRGPAIPTGYRAAAG